MRSHLPDFTSSAADEPITVFVQRNTVGDWEFELPADHALVTCETLDEALRVAYLWAAHTRSCEVIVQDTFRGLLSYEQIEGYDV
jgi:hypothetical protein